MEISEEVILDSPEEIDAETFIMPFYGKVSGCVNWADIWLGSLKKVIIQAGGQTIEKGYECGLSGQIDCDWAIEEIPAEEEVNVIVYGSCVNGELTEAQTQIIPTGTNKYDIQYLHTNGHWYRATTLEFFATTPPECSLTDVVCDNYNGKPFTIQLIEKDNSFGQMNECTEGVLAFAKVLYTKKQSNIYDFSNENVTVCFDRQTQKLNFELNPNPELRYVVDICENTIQSNGWIKINNIAEINTIPKSLCPDAIKSIRGHFEYPYDIPYYPEQGFVLVEVLLMHERKHKETYLYDYLNYYDGVLDTWLYDWEVNCSDYQNLDQAKTKTLFQYNNLFNKYWQLITEQYNLEKGLSNLIPEPYRSEWKEENERTTNNSQEIVDKINMYLNAIIDYCNS